jgi:hypothetical protein
MAYIGNTPAENYASFLTETFTVSATANYTLSHAVTNENDIRLVINGVVQQPGSGKAYTASGTTLTLTSATVSGDVMYAVYLGRALQTVNPPNASVGNSQTAPTIITGQTAETSIATDDTILIHDTSASALRKMTRANFVSGIGGTNTPAFAATQANTGFSTNVNSKIGYAVEIFDTDNCYDNSTNYRFTPTTAGKYFVFANIAINADSAYARQQLKIYKNGSQITKSQLRLVDNTFENSDTNINISYVVDMNGTSDYLEIYGTLDTTGQTENSLTNGGVFGAYKIIE